MTMLHDIEVKTIDGETKRLGDYAGKALLIVNVASKCGLTPQYKGLEELYRANRSEGVEVLAFPCNQFGGQEPGTADEIKSFCSTKYDVSFPLFAKLEVNGDGRHPLYAHLTGQDTAPDGAGDIKWNFAKFVVDGTGKVTARFDPSVAPNDPALLEALAAARGA